MISLGGGLPHPSLFPFTKLSVDLSFPAAGFASRIEIPHTRPTEFPIDRFPDHVYLAEALQYGTGLGYGPLLRCKTRALPANFIAYPRAEF
jgi:hypothetical protein